MGPLKSPLYNEAVKQCLRHLGRLWREYEIMEMLRNIYLEVQTEEIVMDGFKNT